MLRHNKSFQFLVGCFVLFVLYKLYALGVFEWLFSDKDSEGFESFQLIPMVITAVVSSIQLVGLVAILAVSGLTPLFESWVDVVRSKLPIVDSAIEVVDDKVDVAKLTQTLNNLDSRIRSIEITVKDSDND